MKCARCLNEADEYFFHGTRGWYCRKCIKFGESQPPESEMKEVDPEYHLNFSLTARQAEISHKLTEYVRKGESVLLEAVCGAGKTEIVFEMIADALASGKRVGMSIARRQVVLEIVDRLKEAFSLLKVVAVCQGYTKDTEGDLIVCTTHQLYRYADYFDVLILDEPDAFPFKGDSTLHGIAQNACHGSFVYLTATPDEELRNNEKLQRLYLSKRPHGHDLCVPEAFYGPEALLIVRGIIWLWERLKNPGRIMLFVPSRKTGKIFQMMIGLLMPCGYVSSDTLDKDKVISDFRNDKYRICVCTSVLERGITIANVHVLVWKADNGVFDEAALTQISGRVGRNRNYPDGKCLFLCTSRQPTIDGCISSIRKANDD